MCDGFDVKMSEVKTGKSCYEIRDYYHIGGGYAGVTLNVSDVDKVHAAVNDYVAYLNAKKGAK